MTKQSIVYGMLNILLSKNNVTIMEDHIILITIVIQVGYKRNNLGAKYLKIKKYGHLLLILTRYIKNICYF